MPRGPRLDVAGAVHHVMARGIERRRLFRDDVDRTAFLSRLDEVCVQGEAKLYAWSLMPNHFHLLLRTGTAPLSTLMQRLLTTYAVGFNRRHRRAGHLLQNRFKSIVVEEESYLLELVRYIHLNPVRARLVAADALASYPWAGHAALLGGARLDAHDIDFVLRRFGRTMRAAQQAMRQFIADGAGQGRRPELCGGGLRRSLRAWQPLAVLRRGREGWASDERILGSSDFVRQTLREMPPPPLPAADRGESLAAALAVVASRCGIELAELRSNSHRPNAVTGRAIICFIGVVRHGLTPTAVAGQLGISRRSVIRSLERAQQLPNLFPHLADLLR